MSIFIFWVLELKLEDNQNQGLFYNEPKVNQNRLGIQKNESQNHLP